MKKKVLKIVGILAILMIVAVVVIYFMLGSIIKKGVETVGPDLTKGDVKLESASLSIFGSGGIKGLEIGNPKNGDFTSPFAFKLGSADVKVQIGSVMSDKIIVEEILIDGAEVCFEGLTGSNHQKILENIEAYTGGGDAKPDEEPKEEKPGKKIIINLFKMTNTKIHLHVLGKTVPIPMPDFEKRDIGKEEGGATLKETITAIYDSLYDSLKNIVKGAGDLIMEYTGKGVDAIKDIGSGAVDGVKDGVNSIKDGASDALDSINPFK